MDRYILEDVLTEIGIDGETQAKIQEAIEKKMNEIYQIQKLPWGQGYCIMHWDAPLDRYWFIACGTDDVCVYEDRVKAIEILKEIKN